ncbi:hypothetical protein IEE94_13855 [Yimella sp. cx-573]|nr:hypothetical protein [Yimella sp. cx-573]
MTESGGRSGRLRDDGRGDLGRRLAHDALAAEMPGDGEQQPAERPCAQHEQREPDVGRGEVGDVEAVSLLLD